MSHFPTGLVSSKTKVVAMTFAPTYIYIIILIRNTILCVIIVIYRFIKLLVQEFSVQLDKGFLLSMYDIVSRYHAEEKPSVRIRADIALVHIPIAMIAAKVNFFKINIHKLILFQLYETIH